MTPGRRVRQVPGGRAIVVGVAGRRPALRRDEAAVVAIMRQAIDAWDGDGASRPPAGLAKPGGSA